MGVPESISRPSTAIGAFPILPGIDNGLFDRLDMSYKVGDGDRTGLYRLQIERRK